jgi:hypothetical protein
MDEQLYKLTLLGPHACKQSCQAHILIQGQDTLTLEKSALIAISQGNF